MLCRPDVNAEELQGEEGQEEAEQGDVNVVRGSR